MNSVSHSRLKAVDGLAAIHRRTSGSGWSTSSKKRRFMEPVERIAANGCTLAYVIRRELEPVKTTFLTPETLNFQAGLIIFPHGYEIQRTYQKHIIWELTSHSQV